MKNILLAILFVSVLSISLAQTKPGTSFSGTTGNDPEVCAASVGNFVSEKQVEDMITEMLAKVGARNRYIIINCTQVENCQAFLFRGKPYILYNPNFLGQVKKLNFSSASLPNATEKDWETLTILAHELGHHINNHLLNPLPDATQREMELEADETAGFIIYLLGGTLSQAKFAFNNVPEKGSYTHPGRQQRIDAVAKGWNDAEKKYHRSVQPIPNSEKPFSPGNSNEWTPASDIDGNIYKTIKINNQIWMQSNLNVSHFKNGDIIPEVKNDNEWLEADRQKKPAWCYYNNNPAYGDIYGKIYNWYAVNDPRGLAPEGWHVASEIEWSRLINVMGGDNSAAGRLKATSFWKPPNTDATDAVGFYALPGGSRMTIGPFGQFKEETGRWWTSTIDADRLNAWNIFMYYNKKNIEKGKNSPGDGASVRCIKD